MGRVARHVIALIAAALLLGLGCSAGDETTGTQAPASTIAGPSASDDTTPPAADGTDDTTPPPPVGPDDTVDPAPPSGPTATVAPPAVEVGGWRLAVTYPRTGSSVGRSALICYQVTGPSREAAIVLEVAVGSKAPNRVAGSVGRGSAHVDLGSPEYDPQSLRIQLVVNGQRLAGAAVTVPEVLIVPATVDPACP